MSGKAQSETQSQSQARAKIRVHGRVSAKADTGAEAQMLQLRREPLGLKDDQEERSRTPLAKNLEKVQRLVDQPPALESLLHCYIIRRTLLVPVWPLRSDRLSSIQELPLRCRLFHAPSLPCRTLL